MVFCCSFLHPYSPVVAVDIVQPAALLHHLHGARDVLPRGEAMPPLVFLPGGAGFNPAAVGAILLPAGVVVSALLCLGAPQNGTWTGGTHFNQGFSCKKRQQRYKCNSVFLSVSNVKNSCRKEPKN